MINVLKDILNNIKDNGLSDRNCLYITFLANHKNVKIPNWLKEKYPDEITIVIQYEYFNLKINNDFFYITLSFNDIKADLKIAYDSIISFADPLANFGLKLQNDNNSKTTNSNVNKNKKNKKNNIIKFSNFKKN